MPRNLYVNLPVKDLDRTVDFFAALGATGTHQLTALLATLRHSHQQPR